MGETIMVCPVFYIMQNQWPHKIPLLKIRQNDFGNTVKKWNKAIILQLKLLQGRGEFVSMEIIYAFGILMWLFIALKWGKWSVFKENLFAVFIVIIGDLLYNVLTNNKLWVMVSPTFHIRSDVLGIIVSFLCFPCSTVVFLTHYPENGFLKQVGYNIFWVALYTSHEWIAYELGVFWYANGWNIGWSILLNSIAFPFIRLHQKNQWYHSLFLSFVHCFLQLCFMYHFLSKFTKNKNAFTEYSWGVLHFCSILPIPLFGYTFRQH